MSWRVELLLEKDSPPATVEEAVLSPAKMKLLLLCLGLTLICAQEEENNNAVTSNFDLSKISGEWYSVLMASDQREEMEEDGNMRVFVEHIGY
ncbi:Fel d 4 [Plecturocebus cupreus]